MFHERVKTLEGFSLVLDGVSISVAFGLALLLRVFHESLPLLSLIPSTEWVTETAYRSDYALVWMAAIFASLTYAKVRGAYVRLHTERWRWIVPWYAKVMIAILFATGSLVFALKMSISRLFFGYFFVLLFVLLVTKQGVLEWLLGRLRASDLHRRHALVVGPRMPALWFAGIVESASSAGYRLVGVLSTDSGGREQIDGVSILGSLDDLDRVLVDSPVEEVFLIGSAHEIAELGPVARRLVEKGRMVSLITNLGGNGSGLSGRVTHFDGIPMISWGPMPKDEVGSGVKRTIDVAISLVALVLLSPFFLFVALAIALLDPGPVFFRQERLGRGGYRFVLRKFRSMRADAEEVLRSDPALHRTYVDHGYKLPEETDPRITGLGRFLRKTSLDELPQLWNVLKGDMTLVGPRPIVPEEIEKYEPYAELFLSVRPGLTGQWQVSGRSAVPYPARAFLDLNYVGNNSVIDDMSIMLRTVPAVFRRKGAY